MKMDHMMKQMRKMNSNKQSDEALIWYHYDELLRLYHGERFGDLFTKHSQDTLNKYKLVESIRLNGTKAKQLTEYTKRLMGIE